LRRRGQASVDFLEQRRADATHVVFARAQRCEVQEQARGVAQRGAILKEVSKRHRARRPRVLALGLEVHTQHLLAQRVIAGARRLEAREERIANAFERSQVFNCPRHAVFSISRGVAARA
jgi:hypothetical protein